MPLRLPLRRPSVANVLQAKAPMTVPVALQAAAAVANVSCELMVLKCRGLLVWANLAVPTPSEARKVVKGSRVLQHRKRRYDHCFK